MCREYGCLPLMSSECIVGFSDLMLWFGEEVQKIKDKLSTVSESLIVEVKQHTCSLFNTPA